MFTWLLIFGTGGWWDLSCSGFCLPRECLVWIVIYPLWRREAWNSRCPFRLRFYVCDIFGFGYTRMGYQLARRHLSDYAYCFGRGRSRAHLERPCAHTEPRRRRHVSTDLPGTRMPVFGADEVSPLVVCWNLKKRTKAALLSAVRNLAEAKKRFVP